MKKTIEEIVKDALEKVYRGELPVYSMETWNDGYVDDLTDEAVGIYRLAIDIADDIIVAPTAEAVHDRIVEDTVIAPDYTRFNDHHIILYWLDERACHMTVKYAEDVE